MLPWVCSVIGYRRHQNVVGTVVTHAIGSASSTTFMLNTVQV